MLKTIHDGSVSYSIRIPNPPDGKGKHTKSLKQRLRRHSLNRIKKEGVLIAEHAEHGIN